MLLGLVALTKLDTSSGEKWRNVTDRFGSGVKPHNCHNRVGRIGVDLDEKLYVVANACYGGNPANG